MNLQIEHKVNSLSMRNVRKTILLVIFGVVLFGTNTLLASDNVITIYYNKSIGQLNKRVFGNNTVAYDPTTYEDWAKEYYGYSDYGAGIWNPKLNRPVKEVVDMAKKSGISILRFPGGCGTHHYDWKKSIGKNRQYFLFGLDEFLKICKAIGAEPIITVSYFTGDEQDAADLVEYLNSLNDGSNLNGGIDWAKERAKNGHPSPYNVKYFEIGNEDWHGDHRNIKQVLPEEYANRYLKYYTAMKACDPSINIGVILSSRTWDFKVMNTVKEKLEFGILHVYPLIKIDKDKLRIMRPEDIFTKTFGLTKLDVEASFISRLKLLKEKSNRDIPLAITEYNTGLVYDEPLPYRHCLGTALLNAELLRIFMQPKNNILMANNWNFVNEFWGTIANGFNGTYKTLGKPYYKRPNYYLFEMYYKYFGDILLEMKVKSESCDIGDNKELIFKLVRDFFRGIVIDRNLVEEPWQIVNVMGVNAIEKGEILEVEFTNPEHFNYFHSTKEAKIEPGVFYKLSGYIKTENLIDSSGVCLEVIDSRGWDATHSTASTEKIKGTTDWQYVEVIYQTLQDATAVKIIARRVGEQGPLNGKAYFKDVKLQKFIPDIDTKMPYLSVNTSKNSEGNKIYLMVINKNMNESIASTIDLKDFNPSEKGKAWVLNGPSVDATNEVNHDNVKIIEKKFEIKSNPFQFTFDPHSLTAIEIESK